MKATNVSYDHSIIYKYNLCKSTMIIVILCLLENVDIQSNILNWESELIKIQSTTVEMVIDKDCGVYI